MSDFQDCTGGRAFEILVKQHPEMSLFVKHVADKQQFPVFPDATVDIDLPCLVPVRRLPTQSR